MRIETGKILIEGMDLSGKTTITRYLSEILKIDKIQERTLSDSCAIYDFTVAQSKQGKLHPDLINKLYTLAISEDLYNYKPKDNITRFIFCIKKLCFNETKISEYFS